MNFSFKNVIKIISVFFRHSGIYTDVSICDKPIQANTILANQSNKLPCCLNKSIVSGYLNSVYRLWDEFCDFAVKKDCTASPPSLVLQWKPDIRYPAPQHTHCHPPPAGLGYSTSQPGPHWSVVGPGSLANGCCSASCPPIGSGGPV